VVVRKRGMDGEQGNQSVSEVHLYLPANAKNNDQIPGGKLRGRGEKSFFSSVCTRLLERGSGSHQVSCAAEAIAMAHSIRLVLIDASQNEQGRAGFHGTILICSITVQQVNE